MSMITLGKPKPWFLVGLFSDLYVRLDAPNHRD